MRLGLIGGLGAAIALSSPAAQADQASEDAALLVDEGFVIFMEETWDGNGRTCGTCHIPAENYNIFPSTIAGLNGKELNILLAKKVDGLENRDLVISHAIFNVSGNGGTHGADEPELFGTEGHEGPIFRSTMNLAGLALTTLNTAPTFPGTPLFPVFCSIPLGPTKEELPQLGWSGDGSPGTPVANPACQTHHGLVVCII